VEEFPGRILPSVSPGQGTNARKRRAIEAQHGAVVDVYDGSVPLGAESGRSESASGGSSSQAIAFSRSYGEPSQGGEVVATHCPGCQCSVGLLDISKFERETWCWICLVSVGKGHPSCMQWSNHMAGEAHLATAAYYHEGQNGLDIFNESIQSTYLWCGACRRVTHSVEHGSSDKHLAKLEALLKLDAVPGARIRAETAEVAQREVLRAQMRRLNVDPTAVEIAHSRLVVADREEVRMRGLAHAMERSQLSESKSGKEEKDAQ
jgi:hypothetical protein